VLLSAASLATQAVVARTAAAAPGGVLPPTEAAWLSDYQLGHASACAMLTACQSFSAAERMQPLRTYLDAADASLQVLRSYSAAQVSALRARAAWCAATCEALGHGAGCRQAAAVALPPLVARLAVTHDAHTGGLARGAAALAALAALARAPAAHGGAPARFTLLDAGGD
jgi:hypothetical protein